MPVSLRHYSLMKFLKRLLSNQQIWDNFRSDDRHVIVDSLVAQK